MYYIRLNYARSDDVHDWSTLKKFGIVENKFETIIIHSAAGLVLNAVIKLGPLRHFA